MKTTMDMRVLILLPIAFELVTFVSAWGSDVHHEEPVNWNVHFESGKESAALYERGHSMFERRHLKVQNLVGKGSDVSLTCEDTFSRFSKDGLKHGDVWEFTVYDWFGRRHYWCTAKLNDGKEYTFRAYGEGAPRAHNRIILLKTGAVINGRDVTIDETDDSADDNTV